LKRNVGLNWFLCEFNPLAQGLYLCGLDITGCYLKNWRDNPNISPITPFLKPPLREEEKKRGRTIPEQKSWLRHWLQSPLRP